MIPFLAIGPGPDYPAENDVQSGVDYDFGNLTGTLTGTGGGTGDAEQATLLEVQETVEAIAVSIAGTAPQVVSRVAGGTITAYVSDDFRVRSGTQLKIPVSDPAGALNTKLAAIGVANLAFAAAAPNKPAAQITGTIASLAHASGVLTISVEIVACGNGLQPGDYLYQIQSTQAHSGEFDDFVELSGTLILERRVVLPRG